MRNVSWLRYGLMMAMGGSIAMGVFVACSDDPEVTPPTSTPRPDSGTTTPEPDASSTPDAGDAGPTTPIAKISIINAGTDFGPTNPAGAVRVCFALTAPGATPVIASVPPLPDEPPASNPSAPPGIYIGTGGAFRSFGIPLDNAAVTPYVMNSTRLAQRGIVKPGPGSPGLPCSEILKPGATLDGGAAIEGVDYWKLPDIPSQTLLSGKSFVLVLTGCSGDATSTPGKCGEGFSPDGGVGNGNLKVRIFEVDRATTIASNAIGTQFIHASAAGAAFLAAAAPDGGIPVVPGYVSADGGFKPVSGGTPVAYADKTSLVQVEGVEVTTDRFTANPAVPTLGIPLQAVQLMTYGRDSNGNPLPPPDGGAYRNGAAFTFVAVGDPEQPQTVGGVDGGPFNTRTFHYLGVPNDPTIVPYRP